MLIILRYKIDLKFKSKNLKALYFFRIHWYMTLRKPAEWCSAGISFVTINYSLTIIYSSKLYHIRHLTWLPPPCINRKGGWLSNLIFCSSVSNSRIFRCVPTLFFSMPTLKSPISSINWSIFDWLPPSVIKLCNWAHFSRILLRAGKVSFWKFNCKNSESI